MALAPSKRKDKGIGEGVESKELDVTPIMGVFVILIPALLLMAVFTEIAVIDFSIPQSSDSEESQEKEKEDDDEKQLDISVSMTNMGFTIRGVPNPPPRGSESEGKI